MFFDMGIGELLIIGAVGLVIFGPERLPKVAAQTAQFLRQFRQQADAAKASIIEAAAIDESTLRDIRDLDPRRAIREVVAPVDRARRAVSDAARIPPVTPNLPHSSSQDSSLPPARGVNPDDIV